MTYKLLKKCLFVICLLSIGIASGQEKLGISNSNYSSTNSIYLNPSSSVDSRTYMQLNLVGANLFAMTNIAYLPKFSFWSLKNSGSLESIQLSGIKLKKYFYAAGELNALAFVISKRNYGAGFFVRARSVADAKNIPYELTDYLLNQNTNSSKAQNSDLNLKNVKFSNMSWVEYGLNFGMMVKKLKTDMLTVGGSARYLTGINLAYGNLESLKGTIRDSATKIDEMSGKLRFNQPGWNTGKGFGIDIGVTYKKMLSSVDAYFANSKLSNCKYIDYKYKIAATLRDVGYLRFTKNTSTANFDAQGNTSDRNDTAYKSYLNLNFNSTSKTNVPIWATLPTVLSIQGDYNFGNHFYVNATIVKNIIPTKWVGVQGANLLSVCPRYEFKNFEVAMPLTFQRFIYPQLGLAFRVRTFVLGFDNLFPLFLKKNTYGLNVYFSIGISLFNNPACKIKGQRAVDCPPNVFLKKEKKRNKKGTKPHRPKKHK
jgi:hypothetical protein